MNKNLNLFEILKNVPKGTKLYSPLFGEVKFDGFNNTDELVLISDIKDCQYGFYFDGKFWGYYPDAECLLFPSKDQRDWSKFEAPKQKVKVTLHPFDKVLVRDEKDDKWLCTFFSYINMNRDCSYATSAGFWNCCIPYNEQTKHLVGTTDECPIEYEIEFEK